MVEELAVRMEGTRGVPMLETDRVEEIRVLTRCGRGVRWISRELGLSRNTVKRYLSGQVAGVQERSSARKLTAAQVSRAEELWRTKAEGNAVVVRDLLALEGVPVALRTLQRYLQPFLQASQASQVAAVRFETPPGQQMQIDFGERRVSVGGSIQTVYFFVATLGFSRRIYVRASLSQRQDEWLLGLEGALRHFGGGVLWVVVDNAKALISKHVGKVVQVHPTFATYCRDRGLSVRACRPYRPRTKGKVESGVKYLKRNGIAGRSFESLATLEKHLEAWMWKADRRVHGTTHERPIDRFEAHEKEALQPLHNPSLQVTSQQLGRIVSSDCYVDMDTVRYSVPHRLARSNVQVTHTQTEVVIWRLGVEVARHRRGIVPHQRVTDPRHFEGLVRGPEALPSPEDGPPLYGRSLAMYNEFVGGAA